MPVWGIPNKIDKFTKENKPNMENTLDNEGLIDLPIDDDIDLENEAGVNTSSLNQLTMYVDYFFKNKNAKIFYPKVGIFIIKNK